MDQYAEPLRGEQMQHALATVLDLARLSRVTIAYAPNETAGAALHAVAKAAAGAEILVLVNSWKPDPLDSFRAALLGAHAFSASDEAARLPDDAERAPVDLMRAQQGGSGLPFTLIFDRFDQHLAADENDRGVQAFDEAFVQIANDPSLDARFLIILDEQSAPAMQERFGGRIEGLDDCYVRLPADDPDTAQRPPGDDASAANGALAGGPTAQPTEHGQLLAAPAWLPGMLDDARSAPAAGAPPEPPHGHEAASAGGGDMARARERSFGDLIGRLEGSAGEKLPEQGTTVQAGHAAELPAEKRSAIDAPGEDAFSAFGSDELPAPVHRAGKNEAPIRPAATRRKLPMAGLALAALLLILSITLVQTVKTPAGAEHAAALGRAGEQGSSSPSLSGASGGSASEAENDPAPGPTAVAPAETKQPAPTGAQAGATARIQAPRPSAPPAPAVLPQRGLPGVYIHVLNEQAREQARLLAPLLLKKGIALVGIKVVSDGPRSSDLRYFHPSEKEEAMQVQAALLALGLPARRLKRITGFEAAAPPRQYELWLVDDYRAPRPP